MDRRLLPAVSVLLSDPRALPLVAAFGRSNVTDAFREAIASLRADLPLASTDGATPERLRAGLFEAARVSLERDATPSLTKVINATGVLLHTNLGRAPMDPALLADAARIAGGYCNLEFDLEAGERGDRSVHCARVLSRLTGAEDAVVVNNNAAAMVLLLGAVAAGRQAIVSRGELIEIGGSFRLPEIFRTSGVALVEVGSTNRTYLKDYGSAIGPETALLLKASRSNFEMVGFTSEVEADALAGLARERGLLSAWDVGSGCFVDLRPYGLECTTTQSAVASGVDLVAVSGDKLLGGPQAGIVVGKRAAIARLKSHPLMRAFRCDKLTLALLEQSLLAIADGSHERRIPLFRMLGLPTVELERRSATLIDGLGGADGAGRAELAAVAMSGRVGGGTLPTATVPSFGVRIRPRHRGAESLAARLRMSSSPVVGRLEEDAVLLDLRTVLDTELADLARTLEAALGERVDATRIDGRKRV
ncbi:MAG: L-seryl-tRNA(Sec) selenium transferase [Myxococcales bacterium]|nr:L-seryl-tRNA(Sec) selenium transferase [Myxococcales bacterium]